MNSLDPPRTLWGEGGDSYPTYRGSRGCPAESCLHRLALPLLSVCCSRSSCSVLDFSPRIVPLPPHGPLGDTFSCTRTHSVGLSRCAHCYAASLCSYGPEICIQSPYLSGDPRSHRQLPMVQWPMLDSTPPWSLAGLVLPPWWSLGLLLGRFGLVLFCGRCSPVGRCPFPNAIVAALFGVVCPIGSCRSCGLRRHGTRVVQSVVLFFLPRGCLLRSVPLCVLVGRSPPCKAAENAP